MGAQLLPLPVLIGIVLVLHDNLPSSLHHSLVHLQLFLVLSQVDLQEHVWHTSSSLFFTNFDDLCRSRRSFSFVSSCFRR